MYLKHKGGDISSIRKFDKLHGTKLLDIYDTWEKATKSEIRTFEKNNNVVNDRSNKGDTKESDEQQTED